MEAKIVETTYASKIDAAESPTVKVASDISGIGATETALRAASTTLAEEARRLVPGGSIEVRATVYEGGHLKVYVQQGFV